MMCSFELFQASTLQITLVCCIKVRNSEKPKLCCTFFLFSTHFLHIQSFKQLKNVTFFLNLHNVQYFCTLSEFDSRICPSIHSDGRIENNKKKCLLKKFERKKMKNNLCIVYDFTLMQR